MIASSVLEQIRRNRDRRLHGELIAIPWSLKKFSTIIPGVEQAKNYTYALMGRAGYEDSAQSLKEKMATV